MLPEGIPSLPQGPQQSWSPSESVCTFQALPGFVIVRLALTLRVVAEISVYLTQGDIDGFYRISPPHLVFNVFKWLR